ncbi:MAG TPA: SDR family NAD(P)-dependent oxidoreductase [Lysobacter sp.]|nr:SDR family NAD(P)-dependent oxidoreductase [Lysobacter sp.]
MDPRIPTAVTRLWRLLLVACLCTLTACATTGGDGLRGKVVVLTGASSGFGRAVALKAADRGATVVLAARRADVLQQLEREIAARGGRALAVPTDVAREEDMARLAETALARYGRIDVWVNNAGVGALGAFDQVPLADHRRIIDVNVGGVLIGSHVALRQFRRQGAGTLVNIGSVTSKVPQPYYASYTASKHAVLGFGLALHQELRLQKARGIRVATVLPFAADTPFWDHAATYNGRAPRMVLMDTADEVAEAIVATMLRPRKQVSVGFKAKLAVLAHQLAPAPSQYLIGEVMQAVQSRAPPAAPTAGAVHTPVPQGTGSEGGHRGWLRREGRRPPR